MELSRLLTQRLLEEPALLEQIPEGADVIVLPLDNPALFRAFRDAKVAPTPKELIQYKL